MSARCSAPIRRSASSTTTISRFLLTASRSSSACPTRPPALRAHSDRGLGRRRAAPNSAGGVRGRCGALVRSGGRGYGGVEIRTALLCMLGGGPPQPPMVTPQAMEQLLRRPEALADAYEAAVAGDDARLHDIVIEAMRFDPLAPGLPRIALTDWTVARGTRRATTIPKGATVLA